MKIGIDARAAKWYRGTGIGTYTHQLINSMNNIDKINKYMLFMPEGSNCNINFKNNFKIKNINQNVSGNFWDEISIPNILKNSNIELYHVPQNGIGLPKCKDCPFIITLHDVIPYKMPETVGKKYLKIFLDEIPEIISLCDGIITVSNYSKKDIVKTLNFPEEKIFVTYLAAENIYIPLNKDLCKKEISKYYSIEEDYILYIGGFSPRKNIIGLIEAFSKLLSFYKKDIKLVIAGNKGISYPIYKKRAQDLHIEDKVIFPGFIPMKHLPKLYNAASVFAYPSFYEGFGLPPLEAMACGTPVVASNITSVPEVVGDAALTVNPHDVDEIFKSLYNILTNKDLRENLRFKGIANSSKLNWNNTAKATLNAYNEILYKH